jgi:hypothetical protein
MRLPRSLLIVGALVLTGTALVARQTAASQALPAGAPAFSFPSGAGMLLFYVRPERTEDFERVVKRISEILDTSDNPVRRQQAASWKIFRSLETPKDGVIYVFVLDPAVAGSDYDPVKILSEGAPAEAHALYESLKAATVRIERMGLSRIR